MKLGEVVTTIPEIGSNVETVECKNLSFILWAAGGQDKFRPLWHHYYQDTNGLIYVVDSNERDRVGQEKAELNKMMNEDEMSDAVHTLHGNSFLGKVMADVRKHVATVLSPGPTSMLQEFRVLDVTKLTRTAVEGRGKGKTAGGGDV